jgi:acetoin utilization protein AcuC
VLRAASAGDWVPHAARYGLGPGDNPIFPGLWEAAQLVAGGSLLAARLVADGEADRVFHFAGGLHHAHPDRASGFCYVNDAVLAIQELRRRGLRVAYVDIDAHHGDGVQFAFYDDPTVLTISTHERGDRLFPGTGFVSEAGEAAGVGFSVNLPLQPFTDDDVYHAAFEAVVPPLLQAFRPDVVVAQLGIDSHRTDPLTHLALTIQGFARAVERILQLAPRVVALGGGGYDLPNVARAWTAAWAAMNDVALSPELPSASHVELARHGLRAMQLWDAPVELPPDTRRWAEDYASRQVEAIRTSIFPLHGL